MSDDERMGDFDAGGYDFEGEDPDHIEYVSHLGWGDGPRWAVEASDEGILEDIWMRSWGSARSLEN